MMVITVCVELKNRVICLVVLAGMSLVISVQRETVIRSFLQLVIFRD